MTTATLRPDGTAASGGATATGAASLWQATNDNSDASYFSGATALTVLNMTTVALPAGSVTKSLQTRVRYSDPISRPGWTVNVEVVNGATVLQAVEVPYSVPIATHSGGYVALSVTSLASLQFEIDLFTATGGLPTRIYELYADVVYVLLPVVAVDVVAPDPYTASTLVPISWVNTLDADGGGQTRYQVKVFTDAQYLAGGFDPDTSEPYSETGEVITNSTSAVVGPLESGDTYRAYVRVAQTVNGLSHWSDWDFDEFTMDVDTSDVDTVTATPSDVDASVEVAVTRMALSEAWEFIEVQRSYDGTNWSDVRGAAYVDATGDPDDFVVVDHGVPNSQPVTYRSRATWLSAGQPITGSWVLSAEVSWESDQVFLKSPDNPGLNNAVKMGLANEELFSRRVGVFEVLGSDLNVSVSDVLKRSSTSLVFFARTDQEVAVLRALLQEPILLVHAPPSYRLTLDYVATGAVRRVWGPTERQTAEQWAVEVVSVAEPADPESGRT